MALHVAFLRGVGGPKPAPGEALKACLGAAGFDRVRPVMATGNVIFGLAGWYYVAYLGTDNRELLGPALGYTLLLAGTAGITSGLALQEAKLFPLALGGALFLLSDLILAVGMFGEAVSHGTEAVWLTYGPGQMLIVFSILSAATVLNARSTFAKTA